MQIPSSSHLTQHHGPKDGLSRPKQNQAFWKPVVGTILNAGLRHVSEGEDRLPTDGANIYAFNHVSQLDVPISTRIPKQDARTMATVELFKNRLGAKFATDMGFFPVDRENPSETAKTHPVELLKQGKGFVIFPEATFPEEAAHRRLGPFKKGVAYTALLGEAENIFPIAIDYVMPEKPRQSDQIKGFLAASAATVASVAALSGGPIMRIAGGTVSGVIAGASLGGYVGASQAENEIFWKPGNKISGGAKGALLGGVLGGLAGGLGVTGDFPSEAVTIGLSGAVGVGVATVGSAWSRRLVARTRVGDPIPVQPYLDKIDGGESTLKTAAKELTEELHSRLGAVKADISGVPYDPEKPKLAGPGVPPAAQPENSTL